MRRSRRYAGRSVGRLTPPPPLKTVGDVRRRSNLLLVESRRASYLSLRESYLRLSWRCARRRGSSSLPHDPRRTPSDDISRRRALECGRTVTVPAEQCPVEEQPSGNEREPEVQGDVLKMTEHVLYHRRETPPRHLSKVLNNLEECIRSKMTIQQDFSSRKLDLRVIKKCALNGRRLVEATDHSLPIDLSNKCARQMTTAADSSPTDEPLNLSTNGSGEKPGEKTSAATLSSPELKRVRLEEMVSYIRKCSVLEAAGAAPPPPIKYHSEASESESEVDASPPPVKSKNKQQTPTSVHRRKRSVPFRGSGAVRLTYHNASRGVGQRSYPVLRQQLLRAVVDEEEQQQEAADEQELSVEEPEENAGKGVRNNVEEDEEEGEEDEQEEDELDGGRGDDTTDGDSTVMAHPHWSAYAYYANLFQEIQALPAAAQGLLITANANMTEESPAQPPPSQPQSTDAHNAALLRKRAPRALTGKHVKHGTGASPATLLTLRQKIEQKLSQQPSGYANGQLNGGRRGGAGAAAAKKNNRRK